MIRNYIGRRGVMISNFFVISGPSGVGKTTLTNLIKSEYDIAHPISYTTRPKRGSEVNGEDYWFISRDEFLMREMRGDFLASTYLYGEYYGTVLDEVLEALKSPGRAFVVFNDDGADQVKMKGFPATYVYIAPPSRGELLNRLRARGGNNLEKRLASLESELACSHKYDYVIINDNLETAYSELKEVMGV